MRLALLILGFSFLAAAAEPYRVAVVSVQDRTSNAGPTKDLDDRLIRYFKRSGITAVLVPFAPPADVDHAARVNQCTHLLYTELVEIKRTPGSAFSRGMHKTFGGSESSADIFQTQVNFRLFSLDEQVPALSSSAQGKGRRDQSSSPPAPAPELDKQPEGVVLLSESGLMATSTASSGGPGAAFGSALKKEVKAVQMALRTKK